MGYEDVEGDVVNIANIRWECFLTQTRIEVNRNCWFRMKLVCRKNTEYVVIWQGGRTGGHGKISERVFKEISDAKNLFCKLFREKTANEFLSGRYDYVQKKYDVFSTTENQQNPAGPNKGEKYLVMCMFYELLSCGHLYHSSKDLVPFPSISDNHLKAAGESLEKINTILKSASIPDKDELNLLFNQFYMKVPHKTRRLLEINSAEMLMAKAKLLLMFDETAVLLDSIYQKLLLPQIDHFFLSIKVEIEVISPDSLEYKTIEEALYTTHGPTHPFKTELLDILKICREEERVVEELKESDVTSRRNEIVGGLNSIKDIVTGVMKNIAIWGLRRLLAALTTTSGETESISSSESKSTVNGTTINSAVDASNGATTNLSSSNLKSLLWHGSCIYNFKGILRHGLKIIPNTTRYYELMFGDGLYFASCSSKAIQYSLPNLKQIALLALCEVDLGKSKVINEANPDAQDFLGTEFQSINGQGYFKPTNYARMNDSQIYIGPLLPKYDPNELQQYDGLQYDEYVVYKESQVKIKYLLRIKVTPN